MNPLRMSLFLLAAVSLAQQPPGDPARGKAIFEGKGDCLSCHRVNGIGSRIGPDLSEMGIPRRGGGPGPAIETIAAGNAAALERKLLDPNAEVAPANRSVRIVTKDGAAVTGRLLNQDNYSVQLRDPQGRLRAFMKSDLRESVVITTSDMPSYKGKLSDREIADVVGYLLTLRGLGGQ